MKVDVPGFPPLFFFRIQNRLKISMKSSPTFGMEEISEGGQIVVQSFKNGIW